MLHSLEDDGSIGRSSPDVHHHYSYRRPRDTNLTSPMQNSKGNSPKSMASPTSVNQINTRDTLNGPLKKSSLNDDGTVSLRDANNDEEISLLSKKI